jgi:hypothetical protein
MHIVPPVQLCHRGVATHLGVAVQAPCNGAWSGKWVCESQSAGVLDAVGPPIVAQQSLRGGHVPNASHLTSGPPPRPQPAGRRASAHITLVDRREVDSE